MKLSDISNNKLRLTFLNNKYNFTVKLIGLILIIIGSNFLLNPFFFDIKIGFSLILIGIILILFTTETTIPKKISNALVNGNSDGLKMIIKELFPDGNSFFLPKSDILSEEKIFIVSDKTIKPPFIIDKDEVFYFKKDEFNVQGLLLLSSGLRLLTEIQHEEDLEKINLDNMEEKLQVFVRMNLIKSISFKKEEGRWLLEIDKPLFCNNYDICKQYPCPVCSAIITLIARASKQIVFIDNQMVENKKITFSLLWVNKNC